MTEMGNETVLGRCLCGAVEFELSGALADFYQCHCSQCRKVTGSASNAGLFVADKNFRWLGGEPELTHYVKDSGYNASFCRCCGSVMPNVFRGGGGYWVPAGALESDGGAEVAAHLHVDSRARWDVIGGTARQYADIPELSALLEVLNQRRIKDS